MFVCVHVHELAHTVAVSEQGADSGSTRMRECTHTHTHSQDTGVSRGQRVLTCRKL